MAPKRSSCCSRALPSRTANRWKTIDRFSRNSPLETDGHQAACTPLLTLAPLIIGVYATWVAIPLSLEILGTVIHGSWQERLAFYEQGGRMGVPVVLGDRLARSV